MRLVTGGHALWVGGWSGQVHLGVDAIGAEDRSPHAFGILLRESSPYVDDMRVVDPAYALADGLVHGGHRVMPADEIDPDYLPTDALSALRRALADLGADPARIAEMASQALPHGVCAPSFPSEGSPLD